MRWLAIPLLLAATPAGAADAIGVFGRWGAFADAAPRRCYAIAQPVETVTGATQHGFASIASWPGRRTRNQLHVHFSRLRTGNAAVTLSIGDRRFVLLAGAADAWAPDAATDSAVVAAMRSGRSMSVESQGGGRAIVDVYQLSGAATAIDAAALACIGPGG